jgi:hypothetical protein
MVVRPPEPTAAAANLCPSKAMVALSVELMGYGSLRAGEALALRRRNVDVLGCRLVVAESLTGADGQFVFGLTKSHQVREVRMPRSLLADLARHLDTGVEPWTERRCSPVGPATRCAIATCLAPSTRHVGASGWTGSPRPVCGPRARPGSPRATGCWRRHAGWGTAGPASPPVTTRARWPAGTAWSPIHLDRGRQLARAGSAAPIWHGSGTEASSGSNDKEVSNQHTTSDLHERTSRGGSSAG